MLCHLIINLKYLAKISKTQKYKFLNKQRQKKDDGRISRYEFFLKVFLTNKQKYNK
jgi:hypothetical protein